MKKSRASAIFVALIVLGFILVHISLIRKNFVYDSAGNIRTAVAGIGDIPFHLTQVSKFAFTGWDLNDPIFFGAMLHYSFLINLISGWLLAATKSWTFAVNLPVIFFAAIADAFVFFIYRKVLKSNWGALFAMLLFFLGSGWGAYTIVKQQIFQNHDSLHIFWNFLVQQNVSSLLRWDAVYPQQNVVWSAPLTLVFLHQRSFILGFFIFVTVLWTLLKIDAIKSSWKIFWIAVLAGITPLAHIHTFIVIVGMLGMWGIYKFLIGNKESLRKITWILFASLVIAAPQIYFLVSGQPSVTQPNSSFFAFRLGWMAAPTIGGAEFPVGASAAAKFFAYLNYLWINIGLMLPLFIIAGIAMLIFFWANKKAEKKHLKNELVTPVIAARKHLAGQLLLWSVMAVSIFVLLEIFRFQPWDFDDNKFLVYFSFFAAPVIVGVFVYLWRGISWRSNFHLGLNRTVVGLLFTAAFVPSIASGLIETLPRITISRDLQPILFSKDQQTIAAYIRANVDQQAVILTSDASDNPVSSLAGRQVIMGDIGWLWTRNFDYGPRVDDLTNFYSNPVANSSIADKYRAAYVLLDHKAVTEWHANPQTFDQLYQKVTQSGDLALYRIR